MNIKVETKSSNETENLGKIIGRAVPEGTAILLKGDLGCGKTCLSKGIAESLGIDKDEVSSPSFTLIHEYENLIHIDLYRIQNEDEIESLGLEEYLFEPFKIKVIEWPEISERIFENFPFPVVEISCEEEQNKRKFILTGNRKILSNIKNLLNGGTDVLNSRC